MDLKRSRRKSLVLKPETFTTLQRNSAYNAKQTYEIFVLVNDGSYTTIKELMLLKNSTQQRIFLNQKF